MSIFVKQNQNDFIPSLDSEGTQDEHQSVQN